MTRYSKTKKQSHPSLQNQTPSLEEIQGLAKSNQTSLTEYSKSISKTNTDVQQLTPRLENLNKHLPNTVKHKQSER